eukprot:1814258-Prorocentrum_lima.AAC.1
MGHRRHCSLSDRMLAWEDKFVESFTPPPAAQQPAQAWQCVGCPASFVSWKSLALHMRHKHNWGAPQRKYAYGSACAACLTEFHTRPRLIQHWGVKP